jgi:predicted DNA-binding transcriptional regulator AlpA
MAPNLPPLIGVAEVAKRLGVSRQRVSQLAKMKQFPQPVTRLGSGPVWLVRSVDRFVENWDRKAGRPVRQLRADLARGRS